MAERIVLAATPRAVLGKQVKQLRRRGILPANVYGRGLTSTAVQVDAREFVRNIKANGARHMLELNIDGETAPRYVVIRGIARQGGTGDPVHIDFFQVDPNRPIQATVPLRIEGDSPAVRDLAGTLVHSLDVISIRCTPLAIPDALIADAAMLKSFDVSITVGDLTAPSGVEILTDPSVVVATVTPPRLRLEAAEEAAEGLAEAAAATTE